MKPRNFVISILAVAILAGCASSWRVHDVIVNRSATCEVHNLAMAQKRVAEIYGMRAGYSAMDLARPTLFPHADEPYDTRACMRCHNSARIWVCPRWIEARSAWLATNSLKP
jgi:hypothetical protein